MWWENLRYLDALGREGTMAAAARRLGVDKATISRRIALLEEAAPAPLFERHCGDIVLTPYGQRAMDAFLDHERSRSRLRAQLESPEADVQGTVRMTAPGFATTLLVTPALPRFVEQHPGIALRVESTDRLLDLTRDETDVAVRNVRPSFSSLVVRKIGTMGLSGYASERYLAERGDPRTAMDLAQHHIVNHGSVRFAGAGFDDTCAEVNLARVSYRADDAFALRAAARAHLGIAVLPHFIGDDCDDLRRLPVMGEGAIDLLLITRTEQRRVRRVRIVADFLADLVQQHQDRLYAPS